MLRNDFSLTVALAVTLLLSVLGCSKDVPAPFSPFSASIEIVKSALRNQEIWVTYTIKNSDNREICLEQHEGASWNVEVHRRSDKSRFYPDDIPEFYGAEQKVITGRIVRIPAGQTVAVENYASRPHSGRYLDAKGRFVSRFKEGDELSLRVSELLFDCRFLSEGQARSAEEVQIVSSDFVPIN